MPAARHQTFDSATLLCIEKLEDRTSAFSFDISSVFITSDVKIAHIFANEDYLDSFLKAMPFLWDGQNDFDMSLNPESSREIPSELI